VWTEAEVRQRLLTQQDVLPSMTEQYSPTWWGLTDKNQYLRRWVSGNYVPGCHYNWIKLNGLVRVVGGYDHLWSDNHPPGPHWPQEGITQYAYVYSDALTEQRDIQSAWNQDCSSGHLPYRQLIAGYYSPPVKVVDQTILNALGGWAHKRVIEKRWPDNSTTPEVDIFDYLQNGNVLIVDLTVEQYLDSPSSQHWDRTIADADTMLGHEIAKLNA
jgi:hypothetical protein